MRYYGLSGRSRRYTMLDRTNLFVVVVVVIVVVLGEYCLFFSWNTKTDCGRCIALSAARTFWPLIAIPVPGGISLMCVSADPIQR